MKYLKKIIDDETRALVVNTAKQKEKILLSHNYLALIKFKQLCVTEELCTAPPNKIAERRTLWETKYKITIDSLTFRKPMNYITLKHSTAGSISDSTTVLNGEPMEELDVQIDYDEFVDAVENVVDIPFTTIQNLVRTCTPTINFAIIY